jgi:hypothetical protein
MFFICLRLPSADGSGLEGTRNIALAAAAPTRQLQSNFKTSWR